MRCVWDGNLKTKYQKTFRLNITSAKVLWLCKHLETDSHSWVTWATFLTRSVWPLDFFFLSEFLTKMCRKLSTTLPFPLTAVHQTCPESPASSPPGGSGRSPAASLPSPAPPAPSAASGWSWSWAFGEDPGPSILSHDQHTWSQLSTIAQASHIFIELDKERQ